MITFRPAVPDDVDRIEEIYNHVHDAEEAGQLTIGWDRAIYPTRATAEEAVRLGGMFVEEDDRQIVAAGRLNQAQVHPTYDQVPWLYAAAPEQVFVLHTLVVDPCCGGHGYGPAFARFYEAEAKRMGCSVLRIDTNERNTRARRMYAKLGYREADIVPCVFNGIPSVHLVCLEKKLD